MNTNSVTTNPAPQRLRTPELELCYFEWHTGEAPGAATAQTVVLVHATGFHARCWDQVVAQLAPELRVLALDMRGHGRSDKVPPYRWDAFGRDLRHFCEALDVRDAVGVGHSMGGHCLTQLGVTQLAGREAHLFRRLLLLDPVIFEPDAYSEDRYRGFASVEEHPVARRRERFESADDMRQRLAGKGSYGVWDPAVFDDYCRYGVLPAADGDGVTLACPAQVEASVYLGNTSTDVYQLIPAIDVPVTILRAAPREAGDGPEMDFGKSPTYPDLYTHFRNATDVLLPQLTHFIPMQAPALVAAYINDLVAA